MRRITDRAPGRAALTDTAGAQAPAGRMLPRTDRTRRRSLDKCWVQSSLYASATETKSGDGETAEPLLHRSREPIRPGARETCAS